MILTTLYNISLSTSSTDRPAAFHRMQTRKEILPMQTMVNPFQRRIIEMVKIRLLDVREQRMQCK